MHCSGPLLLTFDDPEQGFGGKNCQNGSRGKPCFGHIGDGKTTNKYDYFNSTVSHNFLPCSKLHHLFADFVSDIDQCLNCPFLLP